MTVIADVGIDNKVVTRTFYNMQGQKINSPAEATQIYIVKERHADGSVLTKKILK